jgi:hypothetical protein
MKKFLLLIDTIFIFLKYFQKNCIGIYKNILKSYGLFFNELFFILSYLKK